MKDYEKVSEEDAKRKRLKFGGWSYIILSPIDKQGYGPPAIIKGYFCRLF